MRKQTVWETVGVRTTDVVLPNGDVLHTPSVGTLTVRTRRIPETPRERRLLRLLHAVRRPHRGLADYRPWSPPASPRARRVIHARYGYRPHPRRR